MIQYENLYKWQKRLLSIYPKDFHSKYRSKGIVKAFVGTGKTDAILWLLKENNIKKVIILVPSSYLQKQWRNAIEDYGLQSYVENVMTFRKASGSFYGSCNLLVVDECHGSTSKVHKKLFGHIYYEQIIGLSATPNELCYKYFGDIIAEVTFDDAKEILADFVIYFHLVDMNRQEYAQYAVLTQKMAQVRSRISEDQKRFSQTLTQLILKRRNLVYWTGSRVHKAIEIFNKEPSKVTLFICQRIEQAEELAKALNIPVFHSKKPDFELLEKFQRNEVTALVSVQMLKEGYDKRDIQRLIIVSTYVTERFFIQALGRAVRKPEDAEIHVLLARNTTDESLLSYMDQFKSRLVTT